MDKTRYQKIYSKKISCLLYAQGSFCSIQAGSLQLKSASQLTGKHTDSGCSILRHGQHLQNETHLVEQIYNHLVVATKLQLAGFPLVSLACTCNSCLLYLQAEPSTVSPPDTQQARCLPQGGCQLTAVFSTTKEKVPRLRKKLSAVLFCSAPLPSPAKCIQHRRMALLARRRSSPPQSSPHYHTCTRGAALRIIALSRTIFERN